MNSLAQNAIGTVISTSITVPPTPLGKIPVAGATPTARTWVVGILYDMGVHAVDGITRLLKSIKNEVLN